MSTVNRSQVLDLTEFQSLWNYDLEIVGAQGGNSEDINLRCLSSSIPTQTDQPIEVQIRGFKHSQAGIPDLGAEITLLFVEDIESTVWSYFQDWFDIQWDRETGNRDPIGAKRTVKLKLYSGEGGITKTFILKNCHLQGVDPGGELSGETSDALRPSITIKYDSWDIEI